MTHPAEAMARGLRDRLPTKEQLAMINDLDVLDSIREELSARIFKIETDLEFDAGNNEWAGRARNALALHRHAERLVKVRIGQLSKLEAPERKDEECHPLALDLLANGPGVDPATVRTAADAETALARLVEKILALEADRADELSLPTDERDLGWLSRSAAVLKAASYTRNALSQRAGELRRAERAEVQASRERAFVDAARTMLDYDTFRRIWDAAVAASPHGRSG